MTTRTSEYAPGAWPVPVDVLAGLVAAGVADVVVYATPGVPGPLRLVLTAPLLFVLPGYALVAALFPAARDARHPGLDDAPRGLRARVEGGVDGVERAALAVAGSLALLPPLGLLLSVTPWGLTRGSTAAALSLVVAAGFLAAVARRAALPPPERVRGPRAEWLHAVRSGFLTPGDAAVNGLLAAAVLAATVGVGVAFVAPPAAESVTTLGLYTPGPDGPVASDYPAEIPAGESADLVARVENQEGRPVTYTLVVEVQRVRPAADGLRVLEERVVERVTETVSDTGTWTHRHALASPLRGGDLRVVYYLYEGDAPRDPDADSADRYVAFRTSSPA